MTTAAKNKFLVLDSAFYECGTYATEAQAVAACKESAGDASDNNYDEHETFYVAQLIGTATTKQEPRPVNYTSLKRAVKKPAKKATAKKASKK